MELGVGGAKGGKNVWERISRAEWAVEGSLCRRLWRRDRDDPSDRFSYSDWDALNWCWQAVCLAGSHLCQFIYIISNEPGSCLVQLLTLWWKFFTEEANWNRWWTSHLVKLPTLRFKCVVKVAGAEVSHPVAPGGSEKLRMSERCNLKTLTAALCCFYHKNSVITAKVRDGGECVCKDAHVVWQYFFVSVFVWRLICRLWCLLCVVMS